MISKSLTRIVDAVLVRSRVAGVNADAGADAEGAAPFAYITLPTIVQAAFLQKFGLVLTGRADIVGADVDTEPRRKGEDYKTGKKCSETHTAIMPYLVN